jgi:hypothetical protein
MRNHFQTPKFFKRCLARCSLDQRVDSSSRLGLSVYIMVSINALDNRQELRRAHKLVVVHGRPGMVDWIPHGESPGVSSG